MKNHIGLLSVLFALFVFHLSWAGVCDSEESAQEKIDRITYFENNGTCAAGTEVKYISPARFGPDGKDLPCFAMKYLDGTQGGRVVPEYCDPGAGICESMLRDGESFEASDLQAQAKAPDDDKGSLKNRIQSALHVIVKVSSKGLQYTSISFPFGDGVSAFLTDVGQQMDDKKTDEEKAAAAAAQLRIILQNLLGSAPSAIAGIPTGCNDNTKANYSDGHGVAQGLTAFFVKLAQDNKVSIGTSDSPAVSPAQIQLWKIQQENRDSRSKLETTSESVDTTLPQQQ